MSEIVFTETFEARRGVSDMTYGRMPTDRKVTIFRNTGKVSVVNSTLVVGVPRGAPSKRYYYWRTTASAGFRRNSAGTIVPFSCTRPWDAKVSVAWRHKWPDEPFNWLYGTAHDDTAGEAFQRAVWEEFGVRTVHDMYPMLDKYGLPSYKTIPNSLKMPFRTDDWEDFTTRVFGKTRLSKPLVSAVQNTEPYFVAYAQQFRGLVPDAAVVSFLEHNHFDEEMEETFVPHSPTIRPFLLATNQETRDSLISVDFDISDVRRVMNFVRFGPKHMKAFADRAGTTYKSWTDLIR